VIGEPAGRPIRLRQARPAVAPQRDLARIEQWTIPRPSSRRWILNKDDIPASDPVDEELRKTSRCAPPDRSSRSSHPRQVLSVGNRSSCRTAERRAGSPLLGEHTERSGARCWASRPPGRRDHDSGALDPRASRRRSKQSPTGRFEGRPSGRPFFFIRLPLIADPITDNRDANEKCCYANKPVVSGIWYT